MSRDSVEFFVDGYNSLGKEYFGIAKRSAIGLSTLVSVVTSILLVTDKPLVLKHLPDLGDVSVEVSAGRLVMFLISVFFLILALGFWYLRRRSQRSLGVKRALHDLTHKVRDLSFDLCARGTEKLRVVSASNRLAQLIRQYFELLVPGKEIKVAIRILANGDFGKEFPGEGYWTVARSSNFNANRKQTSEAIPPGKGEIGALASRDNKGVILVHNADAAARDHLFFNTANFRTYGHEVTTTMIAPICGWYFSGERRLIGVLYIGSAEKKAFAHKHADAALFVADLLATFYMFIMREWNAHQPKKGSVK